MTHTLRPRLRVLSLGAGVQSTTLLMLAAQNAIPRFDAAIFADTGWEPTAVYRHLERLETIAAEAHIPVIRVSAGNIRNDALDEHHRFASMPLFIKNNDGSKGMARRQCTSEYKVRPIKKQIRELLGYPHPKRIPKHVYVHQSIGISVDEFHRAKDADVNYIHNGFPLIEMGWTRRDCREYLTTRGLADTPRSACVGCPYRTNATWAELKTTDPEAWDDAVTFDTAIRHGPAAGTGSGTGLHGLCYLHPDLVPLSHANLDPHTHNDTAPTVGCSPWACHASERGTP